MGCTKQQVVEQEKQQEKKPVELNISVPEKNNPKFIYQIKMSVDELDLSPFSHYGSFFNQRLKFYHINDPSFTYLGSRINYMVLYFVDELLIKIRYHLYEDIGDNLLGELGKCKIRATDSLNRSIIQRKETLLKGSGTVRLNPALSEFSLIWEDDDYEIVYEVDKNNGWISRDSVRYQFILEKQLKSYQDQVRWLEHMAAKEKSPQLEGVKDGQSS